MVKALGVIEDGLLSWARQSHFRKKSLNQVGEDSGMW